MKLDADAFRKRASQCRDVANGTKDTEAQTELRALAIDLDTEADQMDAEEPSRDYSFSGAAARDTR